MKVDIYLKAVFTLINNNMNTVAFDFSK